MENTAVQDCVASLMGWDLTGPKPTVQATKTQAEMTMQNGSYPPPQLPLPSILRGKKDQAQKCCSCRCIGGGGGEWVFRVAISQSSSFVKYGWIWNIIVSTHRDTLKRKYHIQWALRFPWAWCVPITTISWVTVDSQASSPYLTSRLLQTGP